MGRQCIYQSRSRRDIGTRRATFSASPSKWENSCNTAVSLSHPFESTIESKTCLYFSQLVVPPNRGTFVVVNAACRGVPTTGGTPGVRNSRFSAWRFAKSCCIRATVSTSTFAGDQTSFRRSEPMSLDRTCVKI